MSGYDTALAQARQLKATLERHGVRASIELQIGRPWTGDDWYSRKHVLVNHHTAGATSGNTPSLALVKRGRGTDLPGPLCNGYGGRDGIYRIICMGLANHPGAGGPITLDGFTIPRDSARISSWGTEWEHDGISPWPDQMREFMGRSNAAICEWLDIPVGRSIEHSTWAPRRKIDRNTYSAADGQREITRWAAAGPTKEDDVSFKDEHKLTKADVAAFGAGTVGDEKSFGELVRFPPATARLRREVRAAAAASAARDAAMISTLQQLAAGGGLDAAEIQAAAEAGARAALAELGEVLAPDGSPA